MLLKSGAGPNLTTEEGQTPVHVAARYGNLQTLLLLLEDGGDPQYQNKVLLLPIIQQLYQITLFHFSMVKQLYI